MFCSTCGWEATLDVKYCKRCGGNLNAQTSTPVTAVNLSGPSWAMAVTVIFMLGIIFGAVVKMAELGVSPVALTWMVIVGLGALVALVALIFRQLSSLANANQQRDQQASLKPQKRTKPHQPKQGVLPEPIPSVTENTTRTFEPAYREPIERS